MFDPRRYQVTGIQAVSVDGVDHQPGEVFEADILPEQEERMLARGSLRLLPVPEPVAPPPLDTEPSDSPPDGGEPNPSQEEE